MKLIKQTGPRCLVWAAAMLFDVEPDEIMEFLGHDCVEGVHVQEVQSFAMSKGYLLATFEPEPTLVCKAVTPPDWSDESWLLFEGIMLGQTSKGNLHAVAWDGYNIFDPSTQPDFAGYHTFLAKIKHHLKQLEK